MDRPWSRRQRGDRNCEYYLRSYSFFGKAFSPGLAVLWDGIVIERFCIAPEHRVQLLKVWDLFPSLVREPTATLRSWGTIVLAQRDSWVKRAQSIGRVLRDVLQELYPNIEIGGAGALLYIPTFVSRRADIVGAATPTHCRWMPYLDLGMFDETQVRALFGPQSQSLRQRLRSQLGQVVRIFCIVCAEEAADSFVFCPRCCGHVFNICYGDDVNRHFNGQCLS